MLDGPWNCSQPSMGKNCRIYQWWMSITSSRTWTPIFWFGDVSSRKLFWFVWLLPSKYPPTIQERQFSQTKLDTCQAGERNIHCLGVFWSSQKTQISINSEKHTQIITRAITGFHSEDVVFYINAACNLSEQLADCDWLARHCRFKQWIASWCWWRSDLVSMVGQRQAGQ